RCGGVGGCADRERSGGRLPGVFERWGGSLSVAGSWGGVVVIVSLTPEPLNVPPRVRIDIDSEGDEFLELTVLRDGRPIRQQPAVGGLTETFTYDYEAPFGRPVTYSV